MAYQGKKTVQEIQNDKESRIMETVAWRAGYYRRNPQRFVKDVLGITLKMFQKILLYAMMHYDFIMYLAARGRSLAQLYRNM